MSNSEKQDETLRVKLTHNDAIMPVFAGHDKKTNEMHFNLFLHKEIMIKWKHEEYGINLGLYLYLPTSFSIAKIVTDCEHRGISYTTRTKYYDGVSSQREYEVTHDINQEGYAYVGLRNVQSGGNITLKAGTKVGRLTLIPTFNIKQPQVVEIK